MKAVRKEAADAPSLPCSDAQFAGYCSAMLDEMRAIASGRRLDPFAQFLSVCLYEAKRIEGEDTRRSA